MITNNLTDRSVFGQQQSHNPDRVAGELSARKHRLTDRHYTKYVVDRGLEPEWVEVNVRSMTARDASERLGYPAKSDGIWLEGYNGFGQFRPNRAWKGDGDKKAPKYRTASGEEYDAMLPHHPQKPRYWDDLESVKQDCWNMDGHPCLVITEGMFKAIAAFINGIPSVALAGVEMGLTSAKNDPQGRRYLVDELEKLARAGFGFIIIFDADCATKEGVNKAQHKLACQLAKFKVPIYIGTGRWSEDQGKGLDDYIQNNGADSFKREVMGNLVGVQVWEEQFKSEDKQDLSQSHFSDLLSEKYRSQLAWNVPAKAWYWYGASNRTGVWGEIPHEEALSIVMTELKQNLPGFSHNFANGVLTLLKAELRVNHWDVVKGLVCLEDCVVNIHTLEVLEHQPGYRFLSRLPFRWGDRHVGCEPIKQWLLKTCECRQDWVEVIRAMMSATICERGGELQRYIELVGAGGTGKGTVLRLIQALLGKENYATTDLKQLENNRFETAMFYGKKAIFITDSEQYAKDVSTLKKLTGGDELRIEKKSVQQTGGYTFQGIVWVASNEPIQSSDYTNGLARRRLSMSFDRVVPPHQRRDLTEEFKPYLPGLLFWVLSMDSNEVVEHARNTAKRVPSLGGFSTEILLETNPLANWADQHLYYDPNIETKIGDASGEADSCLYANYAQWASVNGQGTMTAQRFSRNLLNLLKAQLGINAAKRKTNRGRFISCVALRQPGHNFPLLISGSDHAVTMSDHTVTYRVTNETPTSYGFDQSDQLFDNSLKQQPSTTTACLIEEKGSETENYGHNRSNPSQAKVSDGHGMVTDRDTMTNSMVTLPPIPGFDDGTEPSESIASYGFEPSDHELETEVVPATPEITKSKFPVGCKVTGFSPPFRGIEGMVTRDLEAERLAVGTVMVDWGAEFGEKLTAIASLKKVLH